MTTPLTAEPFRTFTSYSRAAASTAIYPGQGEQNLTGIIYTTLGLTNEAGEVAGKLKKIMRDSGGVLTEEHKQALASEAADTLWYLDRLAAELGTTLQALAVANAAKLADRMKRGVIGGSGDNR
jgi:NTP pyrophosphatase (non-canonical NTP hydrolase)